MHLFKEKTSQVTNHTCMHLRKIIFLLAFTSCSCITFSQISYDKSWKKIDSLIDKAGLPKTALAEVNTVYAKAKKENNMTQALKALIYRINLSEQLNDNDRNETFSSLEKEIALSKGAERSILQSILASAYWNYLQRNRYKFYNRTTTVNVKKDDPSTWSIDDLNNKISSLFLASVADSAVLLRTRLESLEPIIIRGNTRKLRPTLFDLLAHRALDYFKNDERNITKPAYAFEIDDDAAFGEAEKFVTHTFKTADTQSLHYKALQLFRQLIAMHLKEAIPDALIDVNIERLQFVYNNFSGENKDELYVSALQKLSDHYPANTIASQARFLLAAFYYQKASGYNPSGDTTQRYSTLLAKKLCEQALDMKEESEGKTNCYNLLQQIIKPEIKTEIEEVNVPDQPFRMLVTYKNASAIYCRIIRLNPFARIELQEKQYSDSFWTKVNSLPTLSSFTSSLPDTKDYQSHSAEIAVSALPAGEYAIISSADKNFSLKDNPFSIQFFHVSRIAFINKNNEYYVVDRETGAPLGNADIQVWEKRYNYQTKQPLLSKGAKYKSDKSGYFKTKDSLNRTNGIQGYFLDISYNKDRLFTDKNGPFISAFAGPTEYPREEIYLFTDRSIYRPGQTVYFKGIVVEKNNNRKSAIIAGRKSVIRLYDANDNSIDSLTLITNDYGSYSGKFILPKGSLNGRFSIKETGLNNFASFNVEEYKRPKFTVDLPKPPGSYRLNDSISVAGFAKAYAGNNIDGASVNYRITRKTMPVIFTYTKIWPPYRYNQMEIAHGTTTTDAEGKFAITFKAIPDRTIPENQKPTFDYEIAVEVTDKNGETRPGSVIVRVGYSTLNIHIDLADKMELDSFRNIAVSTTNMNGVFEKIPVTIAMRKLSAPSKTFRKRYWQQPDQFALSREEYYKKFPYDPYDNEDEPDTWPTEKTMLQTTGITSPDTGFNIKNKLQAGWYVVEVSAKDKFNNAVNEKQYIKLFKDSDIEPSPNTIKEIVKGNKTVINTFLVKNNRFYSEQKIIDTSTRQTLQIEYASFRDKLTPGAPETWKIRIRGAKQDKVSAELLTSMYDASLDQFNPHEWQVPDPWVDQTDLSAWGATANFRSDHSLDKYDETPQKYFEKNYDQLLGTNIATMMYDMAGSPRIYGMRSAASLNKNVSEIALAPIASQEAAKVEEEPKPAEVPAVQPRSNLNETAFFFPDLHTDAEGNIEFSFTTPEALTTWKWMLLAHTKDLAFAYGGKKIITQKELMVQPNAPRFLRQGDLFTFSSKVVNMTSKEISGNAVLQLTDAVTGRNIDKLFKNESSAKPFTIAAGQSISVNFPINIPADFSDPVTYRIIASSGALSDGEESVLPVLSNKMLVTETLPLPVKGNTTKNFSFEKLLKSGNSNSLQQNGITVEFTSNPSWYAVMALPYLTEGEKENAEQVFNRYYANAIAAKIISAAPRLKEIITQWKNTDTAALLSNLQKNEELKAILLQETPWVLEAKTEEQQRKNIAVLFDINKMSSQLQESLSKLKQMQSPSGGFVWYSGGPEDRYMTQYILTGIGHLKKLGAIPAGNDIHSIVKPGLSFIDQQLKKEYDQLKKSNKKLSNTGIDNITAQYLYMRSLFPDNGVPGDVFPAYHYYRNQSRNLWAKQSSYNKAMIALSLFRTGDPVTANKIMKSLKETAINNEELGTYWKDMTGGYYWYQAPMEAQSVLIEAFTEIKDAEMVNNMKTWLLKNKQTNSWKTSKATADACYALLLQGSDWTTAGSSVEISLGDKKISPESTEAGTGYFKQYIPSNEVKPAMGNITVQTSGSKDAPSWGAVYWQYFEDMDRISTSATPLQLNKKLFIVQNTDRGPVLEPLENNTVHTGDKIRVRIELRCDRNLEYVHMRDMRAACMEPVNVLSEYKWQGGLGYYETTKDASTDFFFSWLSKGVYVFEYDLFVNAAGTCNNGITTIQCMYAPEFTSHSEGIKLQSVNK